MVRIPVGCVVDFDKAERAFHEIGDGFDAVAPQIVHGEAQAVDALHVGTHQRRKLFAGFFLLLSANGAGVDLLAPLPAAVLIVRGFGSLMLPDFVARMVFVVEGLRLLVAKLYIVREVLRFILRENAGTGRKLEIDPSEIKAH